MPTAAVGDASALATASYTPDGADHLVAGDSGHTQFVSLPMAAGIAFATTDTVKYAVQATQPNLGCNQFIQLYVGVVTQDGTSSQATLLSKSVDNTELANAFQARTNSANLTGNYTTVAGDRLVVEFGTSGTPAAATGVNGHNASFRWGSDGVSGDLAENDTNSETTRNGWIEFSPNITFQTPTLTADAGDFDLTVADAGLSWAHSLPADSDSFALTVADAEFAWAHNLSVETGEFVLFGADIGFGAQALTLVAEFGSFVLSGSDAELTFSGDVLAPVQQSTSVGGGGLSWQDFVSAEFRRKHLSHLLDVEEKKLEKVEKKLKVVRKKLKALKTEPTKGILANLQALEFKREKIENKIQALEVEMVPLELFLEAEIDEDDEEVMGIFH
jgi:hypothetical protein